MPSTVAKSCLEPLSWQQDRRLAIGLKMNKIQLFRKAFHSVFKNRIFNM